MKYTRLFAIAALLFASPAAAQWQTQNHSVPLGKGSGITGFSFAAPGSTLGPLTSNGAGVDPTFQALSLAGNGVTGNLGVSHLNSGTNATSSTFWRGDGSWSAPAGVGTVTTAGNGLTLSGGGSTLGITAPVSPANGGTGVVSPSANTVPLNQGASAQTNLALAPGQCVVGNASSVPVALAGCRVLLNTITAANSASLADTTSFTSAYKFYEIEYENLVPATNSVQLQLQVNSGGLKSTGYKAYVAGFTEVGGSLNSGFTTGIPIGGASGGNADPGSSGFLKVYDPSTSHIISVVGEGVQNWAATNMAFYTEGGYWNTAGVVTGFAITASTGNITSGTVRVYGYN